MRLAPAVLIAVLVPGVAGAQPPGEVGADPAPRTVRHRADPLATTARWGGGIRLTGLSGIGALPGRNYGGEVAVHLRRDEVFGELALGRWMPEQDHRVAAGSDFVDLKLDLWTLRAGWASMKMPLRGWALVEIGERAGTSGMSGVVSRMVMGDTPSERRWRAVGGGFGVAWPMSEQARLIGSLELAVPLDREPVMLARYGAFEADPLVARTCVGLEVGWR